MAYTACAGGILLLLNRVVTYDVKGISREAIEESREYGFVICDEKFRLSGADEQAKQWFPELNKLKIDYRIQDFSTDFLLQLRKWILTGDSQNVVCFEREGRILEVCHSVSRMNRRVLHCIRIRDDTPQQQYLKLVERYNEELGAQVKEKTARLVEVQNDIIVSMASIVENRDNDTGGHIRRTSDVVRVFVEHLLATDYSPALTKETAVRILQNSDDLQFKNIAVNVAHYHHEKWNGTGCPCGLIGEEIPLEARIMALADVFDALVSKRVYKEQFSYNKAFGIIEESSGSHFDPSLCRAFLQCRPQIETLYNCNVE